jgi:hypothetical protein
VEEASVGPTMRRPSPSRLRSGLLIALAAGAVLAPAARAQGPEFVPLNQGAFPSLAATWQASAVRPNTIFLDLYDGQGILFQTYAPKFASPPPKRGLNALGYRPLGLPTTAALVGGVAGTRVKRVKVVYVDGQVQRPSLIPAPAEWGFGARFFAAGTTVANTAAGTAQVVSRVRGFDRKGRVLITQKNVFTNPF